jgi:hypothetical protein
MVLFFAIPTKTEFRTKQICVRPNRVDEDAYTPNTDGMSETK